MDPPPPHSSSSSTSFPILAISILGILGTAILLLSYYLFIIKCCLHLRRSPFLTPALLHRGGGGVDTTVLTVSAHEPRAGLDDSAIRSIPTLRHHTVTTTTAAAAAAKPVVECSVCLAEFEEQELLRVLPGCAHSFHIDCIDTWLQSSPRCPLCRLDISRVPIHTYPSFIPLPSHPLLIDVATTPKASSASPLAKPRRFWQAASMGDECIDIGGSSSREKDESFAGVQPMRRSFSMDSSNVDRALFLAVQEIRRGEGSSRGGGGDGNANAGGRIRRSFFSFGRSSRSAAAAVLPVHSEL